MSKQQQMELYVANLDCEHDAAALQRGLSGTAGLVDLAVYPKSAKVRLTYDPAVVTPDALRETLAGTGFPARTRGEPDAPPAVWRNPKVLTSVASGLLLLAGWLLSLAGAPEPVSLVLYVASLLIGGYYFGREAIEALLFERKIGIELLMLVAAVVAALMGAVAEGAMLAFLYSISEAAEGYTEAKTRSAVHALMDLAPRLALVRRDGREEEIPVEEVVVGDLFIVKPGQALATDGEVVLGQSSVNQAPVTGESLPVEKAPGDTVFAGTINGEGALEVRATKAFADNTISRIISMVEEAQERKGTSQRFIERFGARYSPAVLLAGFLIAIVPPLLLGGEWSDWIMRATVFIVAAAPCALVISIPITLVATLGTGARNGVLIKGGIYVEELARVQVVALDKTGTLTRGEPEVTDVVNLDPDGGVTTHEALAMAAGIEARSQHPLAQAIVRHTQAQEIAPAAVADFRSLTGAGATAQFEGQTVYVGSPDLFQSRLGISLHHAWDDINHLQDEGKTVVVLGSEHGAWALLALRDNIRANAARRHRRPACGRHQASGHAHRRQRAHGARHRPRARHRRDLRRPQAGGQGSEGTGTLGTVRSCGHGRRRRQRRARPCRGDGGRGDGSGRHRCGPGDRRRGAHGRRPGEAGLRSEAGPAQPESGQPEPGALDRRDQRARRGRGGRCAHAARRRAGPRDQRVCRHRQRPAHGARVGEG